ncbi:hypothetical protein R6Q57_006011 [Mikania cordata]
MASSSSSSLTYVVLACLNITLLILSVISLAPIIIINSKLISMGWAFIIVSAISLLSSLFHYPRHSSHCHVGRPVGCNFSPLFIGKINSFAAEITETSTRSDGFGEVGMWAFHGDISVAGVCSVCDWLCKLVLGQKTKNPIHGR